MKKALQNGRAIYILMPPQNAVGRWDADSVGTLLQLANVVKHECESINEDGWAIIKQGSILIPPDLEKSVSVVLRQYLNKFMQSGAKDALFNELNSILKSIPTSSVLNRLKKGSWEWALIFNMSTPMTPKQNAAILFSHLLSIDALDKVKLCDMDGCNSFFIGPTNRKWCSDKCGSLYRVRRKRKRDKF